MVHGRLDFRRVDRIRGRVPVAGPAEDVLHPLVHVRQVPGAKGQEGVGLRYTRLPVEAAVQVEVNIRASEKIQSFFYKKKQQLKKNQFRLLKKIFLETKIYRSIYNIFSKFIRRHLIRRKTSKSKSICVKNSIKIEIFLERLIRKHIKTSLQKLIHPIVRRHGGNYHVQLA